MSDINSLIQMTVLLLLPDVCYRPSVPRRLESVVNMVPDMVLHSVRWSRRWKLHSTPNTLALSAARYVFPSVLLLHLSLSYYKFGVPQHWIPSCIRLRLVQLLITLL